MRVRHLTGITAAGLLTVLTACSSNTGPTADPSTSESTSSSSSASSSPAESPTLTAKPETVNEFVHRYVRTQNLMQRTGDTSAYRALAHSSCTTCLGLADRIDAIYERGGWIRTRGWVIRSIDPPLRRGGTVQVDLVVDSLPTRYKEAKGAALSTFAGEDGVTKRLTMTRVGATWKATEYGEVVK